MFHPQLIECSVFCFSRVKTLRYVAFSVLIFLFVIKTGFTGSIPVKTCLLVLLTAKPR